jgi:mannitol-1-/sugar-/sorbitol-6-/2-deoxyglucose-6-phosphatase
MTGPLKAVIFDMDGVIIDSEPLWRRAMIRGFNEVGMPFTEADCRKTMGIRINEVVAYWLDVRGLKEINADRLEERIVSVLLELIEQEGQLIPGIAEIMQLCRERQIKMGLATSSSSRLMRAILKKLNLEHTFQSTMSAEAMVYGKPHPEVFLACAGQLGLLPAQCLVIEDSLNGVIAAKAAQMRVIAVPEPGHQHKEKFIVADHVFNDMHQVLALFKTLFA